MSRTFMQRLLSRPRAIEHPGERDGLADVFDAAHPGHETLDAHAEAGVRDAAEFSKIDVPVESLAGEVVLFQPLEQQIQIMDALASADDLAVALGRDEIDAERTFRALRRGLKIECLDRSRIAIDNQRAIQIVSEQRFIGVAEIASPLNLAAFRLELLYGVVIAHSMEWSRHCG